MKKDTVSKELLQEQRLESGVEKGSKMFDFDLEKKPLYKMAVKKGIEEKV